MVGKLNRFALAPERRAEIMASVDWARVDAMTEAQVEAGIAADPDAAPPLSDAEVAALRVQGVRRKLGLSQSSFAKRFRIPLRTLQEWEQGRREPETTAWAYLLVIEREPEVVARALAA